VSSISLTFLTVMPSPYQRELFASMAAASDLSIKVYYFTASARDREWAAPDLADHEKVLPGTTFSFLGNSAHWNASILSVLARDASDLVVVSDYSAPTAQAAMRLLSMKRRSWVFWGELPGFNVRGALGSWVRGRLQSPLRFASGIAGIGAAAAATYKKLFPQTPVFNIPYFCDLASFATARAAAPRRSGGVIDILFSGQMIERKGVDVLIEAFAAVAQSQPRLRLLLLGGGPERERFEALVPSTLQERVIFLGHHPPVKLPTVFASADAFCLPSRHDGWGVVVNEALGAGLPILVSDAVGAGRDLVVDGVNGFVTPAGDAGALADALTRIADDERRCRLSAGSAALAKSWGLDEGVNRWRRAAADILRVDDVDAPRSADALVACPSLE
jgi:glycosyltransferase involved in cell wall biosynthesis